MSDILKVVGIDSKGYGKIPKLVMQDRRIMPNAKCIYAYFASYAGSGDTAFPGVSKILHDLCMGRTCYYKHFKSLVDLGYITVEQKKEVGKFSHNIYVLNCEIKEPCDTLRYTEKQHTANRTTNTNSLKKNSINKRKYIKEKKEKEKYGDFYL